VAAAQARRWGKPVAIGGGVVLVCALVGVVVNAFLGKSAPTKKNVVHQIQLVKPPPPPPPKPPEQKPPELRKEEVKITTPETPPEAKSAEAPPGKELGVDADGTAGSDGFGLAGRKGGRDITTGTGTGGGRSQYALYTSLMKRHFEEASAKNKRLQGRNYQAQVKVWLAKDGSVQRFELVQSSGNPEVDAALKTVLTEMPALREPPPADMPQPVRMRVSSRGAG